MNELFRGHFGIETPALMRLMDILQAAGWRKCCAIWEHAESLAKRAGASATRLADIAHATSACTLPDRPMVHQLDLWTASSIPAGAQSVA